MKKLFKILSLLFLFNNSYCQKDSTFLFKQQKGKLSLPVSSFDTAINNNYGEIIVSASVNFQGVHSDSVMSVYEGKVMVIHKFEDSVYSIITKYGNYLILYHGIKRPCVKEGDYITNHQLIGRIIPFSSMEISLMLKDKEIPIYKWFKWN